MAEHVAAVKDGKLDYSYTDSSKKQSQVTTYHVAQLAHKCLVLRTQQFLFFLFLLIARKQRAQHGARAQQVVDTRQQHAARERLGEVRGRIIALLHIGHRHGKGGPSCSVLVTVASPWCRSI